MADKSFDEKVADAVESTKYNASAEYSQEEFSADAKMKAADRNSILEAARKEQADAADKQDARFIGYADVLQTYQDRSDTEALWARRARHYASDPSEQDFARHENYRGVTPDPAPGPGDGDDPDGVQGTDNGNGTSTFEGLEEDNGNGTATVDGTDAGNGTGEIGDN